MCGKKTCPFESNDNAVLQTYRHDCESILYPAVTHREIFWVRSQVFVVHLRKLKFETIQLILLLYGHSDTSWSGDVMFQLCLSVCSHDHTWTCLENPWSPHPHGDSPWAWPQSPPPIQTYSLLDPHTSSNLFSM